MSVNLSTRVRKAADSIAVIDISGELNGYGEEALMEAYTAASNGRTKSIILNFTDLEYMNSSGIGLLVTMLIRVQRNKQQLLAYGLSDHYQQIFELTRLNEAIAIYGNEEAAVTAVAGVVHHEIDAAEVREGAPAGLLGLLALGDVAGQHQRLAGAGSDLPRQGFELRLAPRHERNPGALASQAQRQGPADPAGSARDERRQPLEGRELRHAAASPHSRGASSARAFHRAGRSGSSRPS